MSGRIVTGKDLHAFDPKAHAAMKKTGRAIADALKDTGQGFVLITFGYGEGGRMEYMSNAERADVIKLLKEFTDNLERDAPGTN